MFGHLDYMLLLFLRVSGLLIGSPIFGRKNVPNIAKIGFCGILSVLFLYGAGMPEAWVSYRTVLEYALTCVRELLFGFAMGFVLTAMFAVALTAGSMIDTQVGFSMVSIYDPQNNTQAPISGNMLNIMLIVLFFSMDGHLKLIGMLYSTLETVPIGHAVPASQIMLVAIELMSKSLVLSVMVAMPVIAAGLVLEFALGAMIKTVPQMNMFVVGLPLKIIIGLLVLGSALTVFADFSGGIFSTAFDLIDHMFGYLQGA